MIEITVPNCPKPLAQTCCESDGKVATRSGLPEKIKR
jgi:hypothetical protein